MKPIQRNALRLYLGKKYYRAKRYAEWHLGTKKYARERKAKLLQHVSFNHQTPLLRKLKNVDMWLQHNKVKNLQIAAQRLNGIIIHPGETFSYWRLIGNTTSRKGYVRGMVLFYGTVQTGIGGGLCQLSNLIYWMALHTPLTVTERHRHSYDVFPDANRKQPFGSGATCFYNYLDLQITNNTDQPFQLHLELTDNNLKGQWRSNKPIWQSYQVYEKQHWITHESWGAYVRHNVLYRKIMNGSGLEIDDQWVTENHAIMMYEPLLEQNG